MGQKFKTRREVPAISDELLSYLDATFPNRCPNIKASNRAIWVEAGNRAVVEHLMLEAARQREQQRNLNPQK